VLLVTKKNSNLVFYAILMMILIIITITIVNNKNEIIKKNRLILKIAIPLKMSMRSTAIDNNKQLCVDERAREKNFKE
jgi:hypothetical protein